MIKTNHFISWHQNAWVAKGEIPKIRIEIYKKGKLIKFRMILFQKMLESLEVVLKKAANILYE